MAEIDDIVARLRDRAAFLCDDDSDTQALLSNAADHIAAEPARIRAAVEAEREACASIAAYHVNSAYTQGEMLRRFSDGEGHVRCGVKAETAQTILSDIYARSKTPQEQNVGWKTIKTAPIDQEILVTGLQFGVGPGRWVTVAVQCEGLWLTDRDDPDNTLHEPTHWQPLPEPPDAIRARSSQEQGERT